jgi:hypothetical protein
MFSLNRWLARLSYSLLICAGLLGYSAYQQVQASGWGYRPVLMLVAAAVGVALGFYGIGKRHSTTFSEENDGPVR